MSQIAELRQSLVDLRSEVDEKITKLIQHIDAMPNNTILQDNEKNPSISDKIQLKTECNIKVHCHLCNQNKRHFCRENKKWIPPEHCKYEGCDGFDDHYCLSRRENIRLCTPCDGDERMCFCC